MVIQTCLVVCEMKYSTDVISLSYIHRLQQQQQQQQQQKQ
jgi:hypothetical protein